MLREIGVKQERNGQFQPTEQIFETLVYSYDTLADRMRELAFLNQGLTISLTDLREQLQDEEGSDLGHLNETFYSAEASRISSAWSSKTLF